MPLSLMVAHILQLEDPVPGWLTHTAGDLMLGTQLSCCEQPLSERPLHEAAWAPSEHGGRFSG